MDTTMNTEQLDALCSQIELAWADRRDRQTVDRLAAAHPSMAADLYDFFALLIETELAQPLVMASHTARQTVAARVRSFLAELCEHTSTKATEIAAKLNVPYPLLVVMQRHPNSVPQQVREELANRAGSIFQFDRLRALQALAQPYQEAMAASRDTAYQRGEEVSFAELLKRAKLSKKEQQYWLSLADKE